MLALGRLAEGWIAPPEVGERRELVRFCGGGRGRGGCSVRPACRRS